MKTYPLQEILSKKEPRIVFVSKLTTNGVTSTDTEITYQKLLEEVKTFTEGQAIREIIVTTHSYDDAGGKLMTVKNPPGSIRPGDTGLLIFKSDHAFIVNGTAITMFRNQAIEHDAVITLS